MRAVYGALFTRCMFLLGQVNGGTDDYRLSQGLKKGLLSWVSNIFVAGYVSPLDSDDLFVIKQYLCRKTFFCRTMPNIRVI